MVTHEEMAARIFADGDSGRTSYRVTATQMQDRFPDSRTLAAKIMQRRWQYEEEQGLKPTPALEKMAEDCQTSVTTIKKIVNGSQKITRNFLYNFAVGLKMSVDEANEYFCMCGGSLREESKADYICIRALIDGDSIYEFIEQVEEFTGIKLARNK